MSRYIDADALIADIQERYCKPCKERKEDYNGVWCRACWIDDAMDMVDGFGDIGIDIVHCRECKYWRNEHLCQGWSKFGTIETDADDFCSYGEREDE